MEVKVYNNNVDFCVKYEQDSFHKDADEFILLTSRNLHQFSSIRIPVDKIDVIIEALKDAKIKLKDKADAISCAE